MPAFLILVAILIVIVVVFSYYIKLYVRAMVSGARVRYIELIGMSLRKVPASLIIEALIRLKKSGLMDITLNDLEAHYLAGGNVLAVVNALIAADKAEIPLHFKRATAIDLAGRDVLEAVRTSVNPKVIDVPAADSIRKTIDAVAKDGIQLKARARVTVRANLDRLVGGATEETIIARVGEAIVSTIGSSTKHSDVLENPDSISKNVLSKGLDAGTAYEILSIDIADIDVGSNIGASLQEDQAQADKRVAQAKAEERRAAAVAVEQEMKARVVEMEAKVVEAKAEVPLAMAQAFRDGNLGVMDFYRMENMQSDTEMRNKIAKDDEVEFNED
ncbi:MAG: flotillin-like protein FloA [Lentisphaeria bacterium]|nr:flotillin-like protein FloA [Lentisphaeria bacterium]